MGKLTIKGLLAKKGRLALTQLAVVLGVAFLAAAGVLSDTIRAGADDLFGESSARAAVEVRGAPALAGDSSTDPARRPLDEDVIGTIRSVPGVGHAAGWVQGFAQVLDGDGDRVGNLTTATIGGSADGIGTVSPFELRSGRAPSDAGEVVVDAATARDAGLAVGDRVTIIFNGPSEAFELVGTVGFGSAEEVAGSTYALFPLPTAQRLFGRGGEVDEVLVGAVDGVSATELARRVDGALPEGVDVGTSDERAEERAAQAARSLALVDRGLTAFALIALGVGGFIIVNTFTIVVAQRTGELALLRALGASRRQVRRSVLVEASLTGLVAAAVGSGVGIGLAAGLRAVVEAFGLDLPGSGVVVKAPSFVVPIIIGVVLTTLAAFLPARRAGALSPMAAMRDVAPPPSSLRRRSIVAVAMIGASFVLGIVGVPLLLAGATLLAPLVAPRLARILGRPGVRLGGVAGRLGYENAVRNPRRTASTASALMIGLALVVGVTVLASSALSSFSGALDDAATADFVVYAEGSELSPELGRQLAERPEIAVVSPMRAGDFELVGATGPQSVQSLSAIDGATIGEVFDLGYSEGALDGLRDGGVLVSVNEVAERGWKVGDVLSMRFPGTGVQEIRIDGTYENDTLEDQGFLLSMVDYEANYADQLDVRVLVKAAPGVRSDLVRAAIDDATAAYPQAQVQDRADYKATVKGQMDILLGVVAVLLGLAVIIAVLGVVNTLALSILERTRELGLLRAVGMSRKQIRTMVRWEAVIIALAGGVLGLIVGVQIGTVLSHSLGSIVTEVTFPWMRLGLFLVFSVIAGMAASVLPARRAARMDVLVAVQPR